MKKGNKASTPLVMASKIPFGERCGRCQGSGKMARQKTSFGYWVFCCDTCLGVGRK